MWEILALLDQSRTMVVILAPGMVGGFNVLYLLDKLVKSNCDWVVLGLSSCLISVVQGDQILSENPSVRRTTFVTSVLSSRHYGDNQIWTCFSNSSQTMDRHQMQEWFSVLIHIQWFNSTLFRDLSWFISSLVTYSLIFIWSLLVIYHLDIELWTFILW